MNRELSTLFCALGALAFSVVFLAACESDGGGEGGGLGNLGGGLSKLFKGGGGGDGGDGGGDGGDGGGDGGDGGGDGGDGGDGGGGAADCSGVCGYVWQCMVEECPPFDQADAATKSEFQSECSSSCSAESPSSSDLAQIYQYGCGDLWSAIMAELDSGDRSEVEQVCAGQQSTDGGDGSFDGGDGYTDEWPYDGGF